MVQLSLPIVPKILPPFGPRLFPDKVLLIDRRLAPVLPGPVFFQNSAQSMELPAILFALLGLIVLIGSYLYLKRDPRRAHLPPHVRGWPVINQTLVQSGDDPTPYVIDWAKKYGEVFRTTSVTQTFVWINSRKAFKELIDRKSSIYSSKHPQPYAFDLASGGKRILFMPYGKEWRAMRNIIHQV